MHYLEAIFFLKQPNQDGNCNVKSWSNSANMVIRELQIMKDRVRKY